MRRMFTLLVTACLALTLATPCLAAGGSMDNFHKAGTYSGQFTDVPDSHWGLSAVQTCYEYGLMKGASSTSFLPGGTLTRAEAVVMASRLHEIYFTGQSTLTNGSPWYQPYVDYAVKNEILDGDAFSDYTLPATRAEMAYILYHALPEQELEPIKIVEYVSGVKQDAQYAQEIYALYKAGILTGTDQYGDFQPDTPITRVEAAAILARMALPQERKDAALMLKATWPDSILSFISVDLPQGTGTVDNTSVFYDNKAGDQFLMRVTVFSNNTYPGGDIYDYFPTREEALKYAEGCLLNPPYAQTCDAVSYGDIGAYRSMADIKTDTYSSKACMIFFVRGEYSVVISFTARMENLALLNQVINSIHLDGSPASSLL